MEMTSKKRNKAGRRLLTLALTLLLALALLVPLAACGGSGSDDAADSEKVDENVLYPLTVNGTEIRVGETKVQTLLDQGLKITVSEMDENNHIEEYEIDPETILEANTYYTSGSVWITEHTFAHISIVTGDEDIPMGEAIIARLEVNISKQDSPEDLKGLAFNGIPVTELTSERAREEFPNFSGDSVMWFSPYTMDEYKYFMSFYDGNLSSFYAEKEYDVDWTGED